MITDEIISEIEHHPDCVMLGISALSRLEMHHPEISDAVLDVSSKVGIQSINTLLHDGDGYNIHYIPKYHCLVVPKSIVNLLNREELRSIIAHELDHALKKPTLDKMNSVTDRVSARILSKDSSITKELISRMKKSSNSIKRLLELRADNTAGILYGHDTLERAIAKLLSDGAKHPNIAAKILGDNNLDTVEKKLSDVAAGLSTTLDPEINHRLRVIRGRQTSISHEKD